MLPVCPPAFIYIIFSLTQIIIDTIKGQYNTAFFKFIVSILITFLLNALCKNGMSVISWLIVFIPFIFMTVIVTILLYASSGKLNIPDNKNNNSGNLIFTSVATNSNTNATNATNATTSSSQTVNFQSSDPQYESFALFHS